MMEKINSLSAYFKEYENSIEDPENFWSEIAKTFQWQKTWDNTFSWNFNGPDVKWFENAKLNITENIFERNFPTHSEKTAIIWEPNDPNEKSIHISYKELLKKLVNFLMR